MSVKITGFVSHRLSSETLAPVGPVFNKEYIVATAKAHEAAGFDQVLIAHHSDQPDAFLIAALAGLSTSELGILVAHRPGFVSPTQAARKLATLDNLLDGRAAVNIISGGNDAEQRKDGDFLEHDQRYARTGEFLEVVRKAWTETRPFDHHGPFFQVEKGFSAIKSVQQPAIPVYFSGASDAAIAVAGKQADVYMLWGETLERTGELVERVRKEAARHGRSPAFSVSFRPILGATEAEAWAKADRILQQAQVLHGRSGAPLKPESVGAARLRELAAQGERLDERLWTGIVNLVGGGSNSTALVGTPQQVADALLAYYDLGIHEILIRGFDPINDAVDYGRELIPLIRAGVAARNPQARKA